jgi:RHH-type rel operon transcriptional repressor/antitoxin RelB
MEKGAKKRIVTIRLDTEIDARLARLAKATHRTRSFYIHEAIAEHLEDIEDVYLAEKRLEDVRAGREKTTPLDEIMRRYDLEN